MGAGSDVTRRPEPEAEETGRALINGAERRYSEREVMSLGNRKRGGADFPSWGRGTVPPRMSQKPEVGGGQTDGRMEGRADGPGDPEAGHDEALRVLEGYASGFMVSQVLFSACELGVFDALRSAGEPLPAGAVSSLLGTCPRATALLLDACAALGLLLRQRRPRRRRRRRGPAGNGSGHGSAGREDAGGRTPVGKALQALAGTCRAYRGPLRLTAGCPSLCPSVRPSVPPPPPAAVYTNTALSASYLCSGSPTTQRHMMDYLAGTPYRCWAHLPDAVRTGRNQYPAAFGIAASDPFEAIYRSEAERARFLRGLQDVWSVCGRRVLTAFDLSACATVCDLGGGSGALARACAAAYPACRVTVMDVPGVVAAARELCPPPPGEDGDGDVGGRVRFVEGDFFRDPLPAADAYILARVLHDWPDDRCSELLARVYAACNPGGSVLVVESLLEAGGRGPARGLLLSLNMLLQTDGGRERAPEHYRRLLARAGFRRVRCRATGAAYDAVIARK
uniref:acetylserotonin O-methyltransferase n=1 Tax=Jaculus jaculus TaxID=51337 RepID=UPI001E1B4C9A|nr:acetylserotonin O-methyltransferase [Jaculus jaculus]